MYWSPEEAKGHVKRICEEIMADVFPNLLKTINPHVQEPTMEPIQRKLHKHSAVKC